MVSPSGDVKMSPEKSSTRYTQVPNEPPPYNAPSSSTAPSEAQICRPRQNYLYITEKSCAIAGQWTIDPNFRVPPLLLPEVPEGEEMQNIHLESQDGSIDAKLSLISDSPTKSRLWVGSHNGRTSVQIVQRNNQHFHLTIKGHNGTTVVYLPRDFQGPVTFTNKNGATTFSDGVSQRLQHFGKQNNVGRAFVGNLMGYGEADSAPWKGDELVIENHNGRIGIYFADELDERSWIAKLFGYTG